MFVCGKRFFLILQFMTTIPIRRDFGASGEDYGKALVFAPEAGLVIGALTAVPSALLWFALRLNSPPVMAALTVVSYTLLTGGLHLDGLGDTFDGLFSNRPRERMLEIMRDSRVGANAVLALLAVFLCNYSVFVHCFATLGVERTLPVLILFPVAGRIGSLIAAGAANYAGDRPGLGKSFVCGCGRKEILVGLPGYFLCFFAVCAPLGPLFSLRPTVFGLCGLAFSLAPAVSAFLLSHAFQKKLGGLTGDVLGAICELNQGISLLLTVVAFRAAGL
jgi:adenosylcobinamide-GDP ribazoletransferase